MTATTLRIRSPWLVTVVLLAQTPLCSQGFLPGLVSDRSETEGFRQMAVIGEEYLDVARLTALYRDGRRPADRVFVIYALPNPTYASSMLVGTGASDVGFDGWHNSYNLAPNHNALRMMQLVAIGNDVVVESVDGLRTSRIVVEGKDPLLFEEAGRKCQILEFHWTRPLGELQKGAGTPLSVEVPVRADKLPTVPEAEAITREVERRLSYKDVFVNIRTDTWFVEDEWYPMWFPFAPGEQPPANEKEYLSKGRMACGNRGMGISCTQWR